MAQQHREETAGAVLTAHLQEQATAFLRSLRLHRESGSDAEEAAEAARALRRSARRIGGALHTFRPLTDGAWADHLRTELAWLTATLGREHTYATRLERLLTALNRLSGTVPVAAPPVPATEFASGASGRSADGLLRAAGGGPHTGGGRPNASGGAPAAVTAGLGGGAGDAGGMPAGPGTARAGARRGTRRAPPPVPGAPRPGTRLSPRGRSPWARRGPVRCWSAS
ncbi:CHAD domain-containing protein [Streptomyces sp. GC420]|nr:CHAD domain-containing protein [Streptomyces sp. GC420]